MSFNRIQDNLGHQMLAENTSPEGFLETSEVRRDPAVITAFLNRHKIVGAIHVPRAKIPAPAAAPAPRIGTIEYTQQNVEHKTSKTFHNNILPVGHGKV